ncbi:MAG: GSU2403 family nucleotidyltransferase fold protein [Alphaproteobacteria bacterium]
MPVVAPFSDEQTRLLVNLEQQYEVWLDAARAFAKLPYGLGWKKSSGKEYLYELFDRIGNGRSLGARSPETEAIYERHHAEKPVAKSRRDESWARLIETGRLYRALRLPLLASEAAEILREADMRGLLGSHVMVIGTNAMAAYAVEAAGRIVGAPDETQDFDMAWTSATADGEDNQIWAMLKAVDGTYTINTERPFQARNARAYEVEIVAAPSRIDGMTVKDRPRPIPMEEQEWLLRGRQVSHVVVARDGTPARILAPDPRWFALQKLWLSAQPKRTALKRPKDAKQGALLLSAVAETMPQFPLDAAFEAEIPAPLQPHYRAWQETRKR